MTQPSGWTNPAANPTEAGMIADAQRKLEGQPWYGTAPPIFDFAGRRKRRREHRASAKVRVLALVVWLIGILILIWIAGASGDRSSRSADPAVTLVGSFGGFVLTVGMITWTRFMGRRQFERRRASTAAAPLITASVGRSADPFGRGTGGQPVPAGPQGAPSPPAPPQGQAPQASTAQLTAQLDELLPRVKADESARQEAVRLIDALDENDPRRVAYRTKLANQLH